MKIKNIKPSEIMTTKDFPVYNEHILKIYFKIAQKRHKEILPPTPVIPFSKGLPLLKSKSKKAKEYNKKIKQWLKENKNVKYLMCDGSHKTTALALTHNKIHVVILETDADIKEIKELVKTGEIFSLVIEDTIEEILNDMAKHFQNAKFFETVEEKTKRMIKEKAVPEFMIKYYSKKRC